VDCVGVVIGDFYYFVFHVVGLTGVDLGKMSSACLSHVLSDCWSCESSLKVADLRWARSVVSE
jgi:hypothetical protein